MPRPKLLCVDDDLSWRKLYKRLLGAVGYDVIVAKSGSHALSILCLYLHRVDAVLLDYEMPNISGNEVAADIKHFLPEPPIIIVSECGAVVQEAFLFVDAGVRKSPDTIELIDQLRRVTRAVISAAH